MRALLLCFCVALAALPRPATAADLAVQRLAFDSAARSGQPSLSVDPRAGFVLTWQERTGHGARLAFAVIDRDGVEQRRGVIAEGSDWFVNAADFPSLVVLDNGDWVSFFLQKTSPGTYSYAIHTVRSRDAGASWDAPVLLHRDGTDTEHGFVSMLPAGDDRVRAVWLDGRHMAGSDSHAGHHGGEQMTLRTATLDRSGLLDDEAELDALTCACCQTSAVRIGERSIVAYRDRSRDEQRDIAWLSHADGRWTSPRPLHEDGWIIAACPVNGPQLAGDGSRVAAVWPTMAGGEMRVLLRTGVGSDSEAARAPTEVAAGPQELGRVSIAAFAGGWLLSRVRLQEQSGERSTVVGLAQVDAGGRTIAQATAGHKVGGYPRLASLDGITLLAWAEAGARQGESRIGLARVSTAGAAGTD